jgi:DNA-binding HxlR family transcriptional regulator
VRDLAAGPRRFVELQRVLPGISTEQLRSRLNRMVADGMLTRKRYREVPPRVDYELTERARELMPILGELARWGYDWAWSAPRSGELVDISAIFRLAAGLLRDVELNGIVELRINDAERASDLRYTVTVRDGRATVQEGVSGGTDALVSGERSDWIGAFSPEGNRGGLLITGDQALAERLLDELCAGRSEVTRAASAAA